MNDMPRIKAIARQLGTAAPVSMPTSIMTREAALAAIVEKDVAKWGEVERQPSQRLRSQLSHGLALNTLAHYDVDVIDSDIAAQALAVMTDADVSDLRKGG